MLALLLALLVFAAAVLTCASESNWQSNSTSYTPASGRFYIYDWPLLINRYANYTDRDVSGHGVEFPAWTANFGAGRLLNASTGEFKTSQFALFKVMYERALLDPRRTLDPAQASSFLIPYDIGMDACFFESHGRMRKTECPLAPEALRLLSASPYFQAHQGHDHALLVGVNQNMNFFLHADACVAFLTACWNCTKLSIDEYLFTAQDRHFELQKRGINWHAVPFPSDYHFSATEEPVWRRPDSQENRSIAVSFVGNAHKYSPINTKTRLALQQQCAKSDACHSSVYAHDGLSPGEISRRSVFCLQPAGDMPTRKGVFDSVLSGCIPVFFHPLTARYMYEWHLGQSGWEDISVSFDTPAENDAILSHSLDVVQRLLELRTDVVLWKRQRIRELAHRVQYSLILRDAGGKAVVSREGTGDPGTHRTWEPDAYDISMDRLLRLHSGQASHNRTAHYLRCQTRRGGPMSKNKAQTSDHCSSTNSSEDPFGPPYSVESPLFRGEVI
ncbi:exostosin family-domain-containing protein [Ochromonadaceae sp. CCMP2298]|nr:exostosin family-domain-containing protein [Ochromonadaceae sp. CCMP2298]